MFRHTSLALLLLALIGASSLSQTTLRVPAQYNTITAAITAAKTGDTVLVAPGTYSETVDFAGKAILVSGEHGYAVTTIMPPSRKPGVRFENGEGRGAILEGFTVTGGENGITIDRASPTIRSCVVSGNRGVSTTETRPFPTVPPYTYYETRGGGIHCSGSGALIEACRIENNSALYYVQGDFDRGLAQGGGIYATHSTLDVRGCLIMNNAVAARSGSLTPYTSPAHGGGLFLEKDLSTICNCAVIANTAYGPGGHGGGVAATGSQPLYPRFIHCNLGGNKAWSGPTYPTGWGVVGGHYVNCIIRENFPTFLSFSGSATYSNIEGGYAGAGNFDVDPGFTDQAFHLRYDSPCRNRGTAAISTTLLTDHEGDPRRADGTPDVGMDEYFARFWWTGDPRPGGKITLVFDGDPGAKVYWAFSLRAISPPATIAGLEGWFALDPTAFGLVRMANMPATGRLSLPYPIAAGFPRVAIHMQALVGKQMTRLATVTIR